MVNLENARSAFKFWHSSGPFNHVVIDNFFNEQTVLALAREFPAADSDTFNGHYNNALEIKKTCNIWDRFPGQTYAAMNYLNGSEFVNFLSQVTGIQPLYSDPGLHGGGWHIHPPGGKLNVHQDYSIHPKLGLQRKINLLVYLTPEYQSGWGGELGLWSDDSDNCQPLELVRSIEPVFNRAVIFDTTQNSWHGLEIPNKFPPGHDRKSLALYYLTDPPVAVDTRKRALFAPSVEQRGDSAVLELIKRRSQVSGNDPESWSRK